MRLALALLIALALAPVARAQGSGTDAPQEPDSVAITAALEYAKGLERIDGDGKRNTLIQAYTGALTALESAAEWKAKAAAFRDAADRAPQTQAALEREVESKREDPPSLAGETLESLEKIAVEARAERDRTQREVARIESEQLGATEHRRDIAARLAELLTKIAEIDVTLRAGRGQDEDGELAAARLELAGAQRFLNAAQADALRADEQTFDVRADLRALQVRAARRRSAQAVTAYQAVEAALLAERRADTEREKQAAEKSVQAALMQGDAFQLVAQDTLALRDNSVQVATRIEEIVADVVDAAANLAELNKRFDETQRRVDIVGLTNAISLHLRQERRRIVDVRSVLRAAGHVQSELTETQFLELERTIALDALRDEQGWIDQLLANAVVEDESGARDADEARRVARTLFNDRYEALRADRKLLAQKFDKLVELDVARRELRVDLDDYEEYVAERVLWIRSAPPVWQIKADDVGEELKRLGNEQSWTAFFTTLRVDAAGRPLEVALVLIGLVVVLGARGRVRRRLVAEGELAKRRQQVSILPTLRALVQSALLAFSFAAPFLALSYLAGSVFSEDPFATALGLACHRAAAAAMILGTLRVLTAPGGLAECHFDWQEKAVRLVRRHSTLILPITPTAALIGDFILNIDASGSSDTLARLAFVVESGSILFFLWRVLSPTQGVLAIGANATAIADWAFRLRRLWFLISVGTTGLLIALVLVGYGYTARNLFGRIEVTIEYLLVLLIVRALALRWVTLARRSEALVRWRKKRDEEAAKRLAELERRRDAGEDVEEIESAGLAVEEEVVDFAALSTDVRDLVRLSTGVAALGGVVGIWTAVLPALGIFDRVHLWQREVSTTIYAPGIDGVQQAVISTATEWVTLVNLGVAVIVLLLTWVAVRNVFALLELVLFRRLALGSGERYAIATLVRYLLVLIGIAIAFEEIGVSWSKLQWLVAGVSVGLGFGLQEIFANFISGITLLFERPIRVGDWVTLGEIEGVVSKIRIRATTIRDRDLKELIVPNREFITGRFINWTLSDPVSRVKLCVGIAYGSDTETAIRLLLEAGRESPHTVDEPAPNVVFTAFGASSLDFELRVFVSGRDGIPRVRHDLHMRVDAAFRKAGVEISFPQRDLHIRSAEGLDLSAAD